MSEDTVNTWKARLLSSFVVFRCLKCFFFFFFLPPSQSLEGNENTNNFPIYLPRLSSSTPPPPPPPLPPPPPFYPTRVWGCLTQVSGHFKSGWSQEGSNSHSLFRSGSERQSAHHWAGRQAGRQAGWQSVALLRQLVSQSVTEQPSVQRGQPDSTQVRYMWMTFFFFLFCFVFVSGLRSQHFEVRPWGLGPNPTNNQILNGVTQAIQLHTSTINHACLWIWNVIIARTHGNQGFLFFFSHWRLLIYMRAIKGMRK